MSLNLKQLLLASLAIVALAGLCVPVTLAQTGSIDYQGPTRWMMDPLSGLTITEGDILAPAGPPPTVVIPWPALGIVPTQPPGSYVELDALSYGHDLDPRKFPVVFSVDEFAVGIPGAPTSPWPPNVTTEGAAGAMEASADIYSELGAQRFNNPLPTLPWPPFPAGVGNMLVADGDGIVGGGPWAPAIGLVEPNPPNVGPSDLGDNLDAIDVDTTAQHLQGPVFFSLDSAFIDPLEVAAGPPPNTGTAVANPNPFPPPITFVGGDVLVQPWPGGGGPPLIYASAWQLGLDGAATPLATDDVPDTDDLDALILIDRSFPNGGEPYFDPWEEQDVLLFSVRRNSAIIQNNVLDSRLRLPIEEGDILAPPGVFGVPGPAPGIFIAAEWLGLTTVRSGTAPGQFGDDLDALDSVVPEPSTLVLLGLGALCLVGYASRRRRRAA